MKVHQLEELAKETKDKSLEDGTAAKHSLVELPSVEFDGTFADSSKVDLPAESVGAPTQQQREGRQGCVRHEGGGLTLG